jgi:hypothetical protein
MSGPLYAAVRDFVAAAPWQLAEHPGEGTLTWGFEGDHGAFTAVAWAREERRQIVVYAGCPEQVPPDRRAEVGLLLAHLNYHTAFGSFELEAAEGVWRLRAALDLGEAPFDLRLLKPLLLAAFTLADHWRPTVEAVCAGTPALDAYAQGADTR